MAAAPELPTLLTKDQALELLSGIRPGLKIEVQWRTIEGARKGARGTDRGVLFVEDGMYMPRRSANVYIPFFDSTIAYEGIVVCREQSAPAARRIRDAEEEDARTRRPPRSEDPRALDAQPQQQQQQMQQQQPPQQQQQQMQQQQLAQLQQQHQLQLQRALPSSAEPLDNAPRNTARTASQDGGLTAAPPARTYDHTVIFDTPPPQRALERQPATPPLAYAADAGLSREIVHQMNDPRRTRVWGLHAWDIRTTPQSWATYFDVLSYRLKYGAEALTRWRSDRAQALERLKLELSALKGSHAPGPLTPGFLEEAHWAEWHASHLLEALETPRTVDEAKAWLSAGLHLLSAHCLLLGNTPKASGVWSTGARLWASGKVDFEDCLSFRK